MSESTFKSVTIDEAIEALKELLKWPSGQYGESSDDGYEAARELAQSIIERAENQ